jgi:hypothetical protein
MRTGHRRVNVEPFRSGRVPPGTVVVLVADQKIDASLDRCFQDGWIGGGDRLDTRSSGLRCGLS